MITENNHFTLPFSDTVVVRETVAEADVGKVTTLPADSQASVSLRRDKDRLLFDFSLPRGKDGQTVTVDSTLSESHNPVEGQAIKRYIDAVLPRIIKVTVPDSYSPSAPSNTRLTSDITINELIDKLESGHLLVARLVGQFQGFNLFLQNYTVYSETDVYAVFGGVFDGDHYQLVLTFEDNVDYTYLYRSF